MGIGKLAFARVPCSAHKIDVFRLHTGGNWAVGLVPAHNSRIHEHVSQTSCPSPSQPKSQPKCCVWARESCSSKWNFSSLKSLPSMIAMPRRINWRTKIANLFLNREFFSGWHSCNTHKFLFRLHLVLFKGEFVSEDIVLGLCIRGLVLEARWSITIECMRSIDTILFEFLYLLAFVNVLACLHGNWQIHAIWRKDRIPWKTTTRPHLDCRKIGVRKFEAM